MQSYVTVNPKSPDVQQLEDSMVRVFNSLYKNPLLNNPVLVTGQVFVANTDLIVNHKLGRAVNGYIPVSLTAAGSIYISPTNNILPNTQIILRASANMTTSLLFF